MDPDRFFIYPDWSVPKAVHACVTTRIGGVSQSPFDSMNLATHVGDSIEAVRQNRKLLRDRLKLPEEPRWLDQVHGVDVADSHSINGCQADAFYTDQKKIVCAVLTADCLPVFISTSAGDQVAVAHAGWKGLVNGVIEKTVKKFQSLPEDMHVWLGPAIGPEQFEVGDDVFKAFMAASVDDEQATRQAFVESGQQKWLADIYALARCRLQRLGIFNVTGGDYCTVTDQQMFYSYRRNGKTGRMASLIWIE